MPREIEVCPAPKLEESYRNALFKLGAMDDENGYQIYGFTKGIISKHGLGESLLHYDLKNLLSDCGEDYHERSFRVFLFLMELWNLYQKNKGDQKKILEDLINELSCEINYNM